MSTEKEYSTALVPVGTKTWVPIDKVEISTKSKQLDGVTIGPPITKGKAWYNVRFNVDWDMLELGLEVGSYVDIHVKAILMRQEDDFPKFQNKTPGTLFFSASDVLGGLTQKLSQLVNPTYRGWILEATGYVKDRVQDYGVQLQFAVTFEDGDVPPGWLNLVVFITYRSTKPALTIALPGDTVADVQLARTCVGRLLAAGPP